MGYTVSLLIYLALRFAGVCSAESLFLNSWPLVLLAIRSCIFILKTYELKGRCNSQSPKTTLLAFACCQISGIHNIFIMICLS